MLLINHHDDRWCFCSETHGMNKHFRLSWLVINEFTNNMFVLWQTHFSPFSAFLLFHRLDGFGWRSIFTGCRPWRYLKYVKCHIWKIKNKEFYQILISIPFPPLASNEVHNSEMSWSLSEKWRYTFVSHWNPWPQTTLTLMCYVWTLREKGLMS